MLNIKAASRYVEYNPQNVKYNPHYFKYNPQGDPEEEYADNNQLLSGQFFTFLFS